MKTLNTRFTETEYRELRKARSKSEAKSWEKWMLEQARETNE